MSRGSASGSDAELLRAARRGDRHALEQLLARHQRRVYRFGMKMCRDPEDAKDVLQDTLLQMARTVHDFRGASSLSTWLYTIARSFCIKRRRRSKFAPERDRSLETEARAAAARIEDPGRSPDDEAAGREVSRIVEEAIASLTPSSREVLVLRDVEGLTAPEVAEVLGISLQAVKSRLHRARLSLRERVAPALGLSPTLAPATGSCPDVLALFSRHLEGDIRPDVCARMEAHLASCGRCHAECDSLRRTLALCSSAATPELPSAVQQSVRAALAKFLAVAPTDSRS